MLWPPSKSAASALIPKLALLVSLPLVLGCSVPVFRYALDRWPADKFRLEVPAAFLSSGPLAEGFRNLGDQSPLNLEAMVATNGSRLCFPRRQPAAEAVAWSGSLTPAVYRSLTDSPARQELARRILAGDSVVWVLVASGQTNADEPVAERLTQRLHFLESAIGRPPQDPADPDARIGPGPELRLQLSWLRVRRDDPAEAPFVAMLAGPAGPQAFAAHEPFAAAVFGRGRVLGAWPAAKLTADLIEEATQFLAGMCSCEVKDLNPGWDLLLRVAWDAELAKAEEARLAAVSRAPTPARPSLNRPGAPPAGPQTNIFTPPPSGDPPPSLAVGWIKLGLGATLLSVLGCILMLLIMKLRNTRP